MNSQSSLRVLALLRPVADLLLKVFSRHWLDLSRPPAGSLDQVSKALLTLLFSWVSLPAGIVSLFLYLLALLSVVVFPQVSESPKS